LVAWLVLGMATTTLAQDSIQQELQAEVDRAQQALNDGEYETAVEAFSKAVEIAERAQSNAPVMVYIGRAVAYQNLDEIQKALADFQKAEQLAQIQPLPPE